MFLSDYTPPAQVDKSQTVFYELANKLKESVLRAFGPSAVQKWKQSSWADELARIVGTDETELRSLIEWYGRHGRTPYTPHIYSARSFREKFQALKEAKKRQDAKTNEDVQVSPDAIDISADLLRENIVSLDKLVLQRHVQMTIDNAAKFREWLKNRLPTMSNNLRNFVEDYSRELPTPRSSWVHRWWHERLKGVENWKEWGGSLKQLVWTFDSKHNHRLLHKLSTDYCGKDTYAEKLKETYLADHS